MWMDLEHTTLSEVRERYCMISFICEIQKVTEMNVYTKQKQAQRDIENKLVVARGEREGRRGKLGVEDWEIQTAVYQIGQQQRGTAKGPVAIIL